MATTRDLEFSLPLRPVFTFSHGQLEWALTITRPLIFIPLVINNNVYGSSYALAISDSSRDDSGTGTVVAHVNQGDDVYIKTHSSHHGGGGILSEGVGRSSFSGWKLN